jgi:AcrR family transcriptional regulator
MSPEEPQSRRDQIVDQALALVRSGGLGGLRIRDLAARVGVTEGALYRHFSSKEEILLALAGRVEQSLLGPIRKLAADPELPPRERLEGILRLQAKMILETGSLPILLMAEASFSEHEALRERMQQILGAYLGAVERVLGELVAENPGGETLEPGELATMVMGLPLALAFRHRMLPDHDLEERLRSRGISELVGRLLPVDAR